MDFIEACRKFISIDSTPSQGNREIARFAIELCKSKGLTVEAQEESFNELPQINVIARPQTSRPALEFLLQTHLDTPDPGPYGLWTMTDQNPFDAHIIEQKIYGLGSADVKLDFLCKLEAISRFPKNANWRLPPVLVGTYGEEIGMMGSLRMIRKNMVSARMALIGEPSDLKLIASGKGLARVEIRIPFEQDEKSYREEHNLRESTSTQSRIFNGKSAHSSTPHLGESAVKKMMDYLLMLPSGLAVMEIDGGVNFNTVPNNAFLEIDAVSGFSNPMAAKVTGVYRQIQQMEKDFAQYGATVNIGLVRTHDDHVFIEGSCRIPPAVSNEVYETWMRDLQKACQGVGGTMSVTDYKRPWVADDKSMLVRGCLSELETLQMATEVSTQPSTNEASLWTRTGVECVAFGPGVREGNIHTPKEHVAIEDLKKATEFYCKVIERFCL